MTLAEKIAKIRKDNGMSQMEFAEKLGVSRQSVSKWESGESFPDTNKIISLCNSFGVSADWILRDDAVPENEFVESDTSDEGNNSAVAEPDTESTDNREPGEEEYEKHSKKRTAIIVSAAVALITVLALLISMLIPGTPLNNLVKSDDKNIIKTDEQPKKQVFVLVHGLGGWGSGSGMNNAVKYWGATSGDLQAYLTGQGYEVYTPSLGPVSSTWDRACELYAVLFGGTVDYGESHSQTHNHNRYGRTYDTPMIADFNEEEYSLNLIGHSFGGEAVRMFASLLCYGDEEEKNVSGDLVSPLFTGGKGECVHSVTTLCSPHNGSSLSTVIDSLGGIAGIKDGTSLVASLCFATAGAAGPVSGVYDFMLDQFGIGEINGGIGEITSALESFMSSGNDHAGYDLSPDGAAELNKKIKMVDTAYYFSYSFCITHKSSILYTQTPDKDVLPILYPFAFAMGCFNGRTSGGIAIDEKWQENDGLVNVISAKAPFDDPQTELEAEPATSSDMTVVKPGVWNVMPVKHGDHGTVIGLNADAKTTNAFYMNLFGVIENLK